MNEIAGYAHELYAASFAEFGTARPLTASGAWLLERTIPASTKRDAMGCYPLFTASRWDRLGDDLAGLANELVSFTAVCDPFTAPGPEELSQTFTLVRPYKQHFVVDLRNLMPSRHHRRCARSALRRVRVEEADRPAEFLDEWCRLYGALVSRHGLTGLHAFSRRAFETQLSVPGLRMFRAVIDGETVAAHWWYVANGVAFSHLQASYDSGYSVGASYALFGTALERLRNVAERADLGGVAGAIAADNGLFRFKRGWSTDTVSVYLCGRILQPETYRHLAGSHGTDYFPVYRAGELARTPVRRIA